MGRHLAVTKKVQQFCPQVTPPYTNKTSRSIHRYVILYATKILFTGDFWVSIVSPSEAHLKKIWSQTIELCSNHEMTSVYILR